MITVTVGEVNGALISFKSEGHAGYAQHGEDIICASVSSIVAGTSAALINLVNLDDGDYKFQTENGFMCFSFTEKGRLKSMNVEARTIIVTMIVQLLNVDNSYPGYIRVIVGGEVMTSGEGQSN